MPTLDAHTTLEHQFVTELELHQNIVHKVCTLYTKDKDSHKDLFQEITIQLWKAYPKFRGESKFSTWMYRVALNTAITQYRKSKKRVDTHDYESVIFKVKAEEYDPTEEKQLQLMYNAIRELGDIDKALVFLYLEDKDYREISETLGISEVNARVKMNRIKNKLKTIFKSLNDDRRARLAEEGLAEKEEHLPKLSFEELYRMIWKRSSSLVKWIFYISVLEFLFWTTLNVASGDTESWNTFKELHLYETTIFLTVVNYVVLIFFIYKFYVNYRKISFTDSSRKLMKTILDVKRTVSQYVWFNISIFAIYLVTIIYGNLRYGPEGQKIVNAALEAGNSTLFWALIILVSALFVSLLLLILWLFYKLLYGIFLKRLRANYKELEKLEL